MYIDLRAFEDANQRIQRNLFGSVVELLDFLYEYADKRLNLSIDHFGGDCAIVYRGTESFG